MRSLRTLRGVMHRAPATNVALFACLHAAASTAAVQLLPAGDFAARDGRPGPGRKWKLGDADGQRLAQALNSRKTPLVIDYEHQTLNAETNGQPAPAAGWATQFEWRAGQGLFATDVQWTARAKQMIDAGEYRFISPVFLSRKSDDSIVEVWHAALVNFPALDGMAAVADRIAARFAAADPSQETTMNPLLQKLIAAIGVAADATEETALTAVAALKTRADEAESLRQKLTATEGEVSALKARHSGTEGEGLTAMKALQGEVSSLKAQLAARDMDEIVTAALKAGKLLPAQEKWARSLTVEGLKTYLETAPVVPALGGTQSGGQRPAGGGDDAQAIALKATAYIEEQAKVGRVVSAVEAVNHVRAA